MEDDATPDAKFKVKKKTKTQPVDTFKQGINNWIHINNFNFGCAWHGLKFVTWLNVFFEAPCLAVRLQVLPPFRGLRGFSPNSKGQCV